MNGFSAKGPVGGVVLDAEGRGQTQYAGLTLRILGLDEKKNLKFEIAAAEPDGPMPFKPYTRGPVVYVPVG